MAFPSDSFKVVSIVLHCLVKPRSCSFFSKMTSSLNPTLVISSYKSQHNNRFIVIFFHDLDHLTIFGGLLCLFSKIIALVHTCATIQIIGSPSLMNMKLLVICPHTPYEKELVSFVSTWHRIHWTCSLSQRWEIFWSLGGSCLCWHHLELWSLWPSS